MRKFIVSIIAYFSSLICLTIGQSATLTSQTTVVLNSGPTTLNLILTQDFYNGNQPFSAIFQWNLNYLYAGQEQIFISSTSCTIQSIQTGKSIGCEYRQNKVVITFNKEDFLISAGIYSVSLKFLNFKNPYSTRAFNVFLAYLINAANAQINIPLFSSQALTSEVTRSNPITITDTFYIDSMALLSLSFTTSVAVDPSITAVIVNIGQGQSFTLDQINNSDGNLISISDGIYLLPSIFTNFPTVYASSKSINIQIRMKGFTYAQRVNFRLSLVENIYPTYPKMETVSFIFDVQPLSIVSNALITIPNTSSNFVGDNSIYLIDFTLSKGFQQFYTIQVKYDSTLIQIVDLSATQLYDKSSPSLVLIATTPLLDSANSIISLTHSNYDSTKTLDKKILRLQLSVRNPLSLQSNLSFVIQSILNTTPIQIYERMTGQLVLSLQPNSLTSLNFVPLNPTVGQISLYDVKLGIKTIIPSGGQIQLNFPPEIDFPFYKVGGTSFGSLNTVQPVSSNLSNLAIIEIQTYPCLSTGCVALIKNGVTANIVGGSTVEFKLNFIRNIFSTRPATMQATTLDQNSNMIDIRQTQFVMAYPNKFNFVQIIQQTAVVGLSSYYDFNIQFNTTHYDGYLLYITYPDQIQPIVQNVNDLNCIGLAGLIADLRIQDNSCVVRNVAGVNKIQIMLQFLNSANPSRTISLRISQFLNYYLANTDFYFGLETVIRESSSSSGFNIFYIEQLFNDPTLKVQMTTNTLASVDISANPGTMDTQNEIVINLTPNTIPQSPASDSQTFYIRFVLSPLLNINTNVCQNFFVPPSNTNFNQCAYSSNTFSIPFTMLANGPMKFVLKQVNYPYNRVSSAYIMITTYSLGPLNAVLPMDQQETTVPLSCGGECKTCTGFGSSVCLSCYTGFFLDSSTCISSCPTTKYPVLDGVWKCQPCINYCSTCQLDTSNKYRCLTCNANYVQISYDTCAQNCLIGTFKNTANPPTCDTCNSNCYDCVDISTKCISCNTQVTSKYLFNNTCIASCPAQTYANTLLGACSSCHPNCTKCTDYTVCQECQLAYKYLVNNFCYNSCPNSTVKNDQDKCIPCTNNCLTCQLTTDTCTTCKSGYYLIGTVCSATCPLGQVGVSGQCVFCLTPCEQCQNTVSSCIKCVYGTYLTGDSCVNSDQCPSGMYGDNSTRQCKKCINNCATCSNETICKTCDQQSAQNKYYSGQCLQYCPSQTYLDQSTNKCISCQTQCLTCNSNSCLSCDLNSNYPILINGQCLDKCPHDRPIMTSNGCVACSSKCITCQNSSEYCIKCPSGMSSLNGDCYSSCPSQYVSVGGVCSKETATESSLVILPFFIGSVVIGMVLAFYFYWDRNMLYFSNLIAILSLFELGAWLFYIIVWASFRNDYSQEQYSLAQSLYAFLFGIITHIIMNVIFFIYFIKFISPDTSFKAWLTQKYHNRVYRSLSYIGLALSFKFNRLLYGRFFHLNYLSAEFKDNMTIFRPVNVFSVCSLLISNLPIFISACMTIDQISSTKKNTQLYINGIEVILMNILMIVLTLLDFHKPDNFFDKTNILKQSNRVYADESRFGMMALNEQQGIDHKNAMENYSQIHRIKSPQSMDQSMLNTSKYLNAQTPSGEGNVFDKRRKQKRIFDENGDAIHEEDNNEDEEQDFEKQGKMDRNQLEQQNKSSIDKNVLSNNKNQSIDLNESMNQHNGDALTKNSKQDAIVSSANNDFEKMKNNKTLQTKDRNGLNGVGNKEDNSNLQGKQDSMVGEEISQNEKFDSSQSNQQKLQEKTLNKTENGKNKDLDNQNSNNLDVLNNNENNKNGKIQSEKIDNKSNNINENNKNNKNKSGKNSSQSNNNQNIKKDYDPDNNELNKNENSNNKVNKGDSKYNNKNNGSPQCQNNEIDAFVGDDVNSEALYLDNQKNKQNKINKNNDGNLNQNGDNSNGNQSQVQSASVNKLKQTKQEELKDDKEGHQVLKDQGNKNYNTKNGVADNQKQNQQNEDNIKDVDNEGTANNNKERYNNISPDDDASLKQQNNINSSNSSSLYLLPKLENQNDSLRNSISKDKEMNGNLSNNESENDEKKNIDNFNGHSQNAKPDTKDSKEGEQSNAQKNLRQDDNTPPQQLSSNQQNKLNKQGQDDNSLIEGNQDTIQLDSLNNSDNKGEGSKNNRNSLDEKAITKQQNGVGKGQKENEKGQGKSEDKRQNLQDNNSQIDGNIIQNGDFTTSQIVDLDDEDEDQNPLYIKQKQNPSSKDGQRKLSSLLQDRKYTSQLSNPLDADYNQSSKPVIEDSDQKRKLFTGGEEEDVDLDKDTDQDGANGYDIQNKNNNKKLKGSKKNRGVEYDDDGDYFNESQGSMVQDTPSNYNEQNLRFAINQGVIDALKLQKLQNTDSITIPLPSNLQQKNDIDSNNTDQYQINRQSSNLIKDKEKQRFKKSGKLIKNGNRTIQVDDDDDENRNNAIGYRTIDPSAFNRNTDLKDGQITNSKRQINEIDPRTLSPKIRRNAQLSNMENGNYSNQDQKNRQISPSQNGQFIKFNYDENELDDIINKKNNNQRPNQLANNHFLKTALVSPSASIGGGQSTTLNHKSSHRKNISKSTKRSQKQNQGFNYDNSQFDEQDYDGNQQNKLYDVHFPVVDGNNQEFSDFNSIDIGDQFATQQRYDPDNFKLPSLPKGGNPKLADLERIYLQRLESIPKIKQNSTQGQARHKSLQKRRSDNKPSINRQDSNLPTNLELNFDKFEF